MFMFRVSRFLLHVFVRIFFKVRFFGRENIPSPPYIAASNHASYLDPPLVGIACRKDDLDFMAKATFFDIPVIGTWYRMVRCIEVESGKNSIKGIREALKRIKQKRSIGIFPEGTRSEDGGLQEGQKGAGFIIARAGVPVVPVYLDGTAKAMPRGGKIRPGTEINVYIGKPIMPEEFLLSGSGKKDYGKIVGIVMDRISDLFPS